MSDDDRTRLAQAASRNPPQWSLVLVRELIAQASASQLSFIASVAATVNLPAHQQHRGTLDSEAGDPPQGRETKKRLIIHERRSRLIDLSTHCNAVVTSVLFPLLGLAEHFCLARCCKCLLAVAGVPPPPMMFRSFPPWNKHVTLTDPTDDHVQRLTSFAPITSIALVGEGFTDDGMRYLQQLPLRHLDLSRCYKITDKQHFVKWTWCSNITDGGLVYLQQLPRRYYTPIRDIINFKYCRVKGQFQLL
jgi:hypothetical protein